MHKKHLFLSVVCLCLFSSCQFSSQTSEFVENTQKPVSPHEEALQLEHDYIKWLRLSAPTPPGSESLYLKERGDIIDAYKNGDRSIQLLRAYIYLATLEGDFETKEKLEKELCTIDTDICEKSLTKVLISGFVRDQNWKPISWATVEVLGTQYRVSSDTAWKYILEMTTHSPAIMRVQASARARMIDVEKIELVDAAPLVNDSQSFEANFTLATPFATAYINTLDQTITGSMTSKNETGYLITTPYTKYSIPFESIMQGNVPYRGKLTATVFEFDRSAGNFLLDADAFDDIQGFASSLFVTYGMPFIIFTAEDGTRLDVHNTRPMTVWTTKRDKFESDPAIARIYQLGYLASQKAEKGTYPIDVAWLTEAGSYWRVPSWWVFDRKSGYWDNLGMRFLSENPDAPYAFEAPFYTLYFSPRLPL
jgi:hypothetical protein